MTCLGTVLLAAAMTAASPASAERAKAEAIWQSIAAPLRTSQRISPATFQRAQRAAPEFLRSRDPEVRLIGARLLRHVGNSTHVLRLVARLKDRDDRVGAAAANALGSIGDQKSISALESAVTRDSQYTKPASIRALVAIGGPDAIRALERCLLKSQNANDQSELRKAIDELVPNLRSREN